MSEAPKPKKRHIKGIVKTVALGGATAAAAAANFVGGTPNIIDAKATASQTSKTGRAALKQSLAKPSAAKNREMIIPKKPEAGIPAAEIAALKQSTVRVIIWPNDPSKKGQEGTGNLYNYNGQTVVITAAHTMDWITGSNSIGLIPDNTGEFALSGNKAVDFSRSPQAANYHIVIADPSSESAVLGNVNSAVMGPQNVTGDLMMMTLDPNSVSPALKNKHPLPATNIFNTLPAKGTTFYMYGNAADNRPREGYGTMLGMATLHNPNVDGITYTNLNQQYIVIGGKWASEATTACTARTSGMAGINASGQTTFDQSLEVSYGNEWRDLAPQLGSIPAGITRLCLEPAPTIWQQSHSGMAVLDYLSAGVGNYPTAPTTPPTDPNTPPPPSP